MRLDLASSTVRLAEQVFEDELLFAFVGGSRATSTHHASSDIDTFVVLTSRDRAKEAEFASRFRRIHDHHELEFEHCGEIFDRATLDALLDFNENLVGSFPGIASSPCYRGNCLLSIFRKGQVAFSFLASPKIHFAGSHGVLEQYESRARHYVGRTRVEEPPPVNQVALPIGSTQHELLEGLMRRRHGADWMETPIGIGLERWFGTHVSERLVRLEPRIAVDEPPDERLECPLPRCGWDVSNGHAAQCLAVSFR